MKLKPRLLTTAEAAEYIGRTPRAIEGLVRRQEIPTIHVGRRTQFDPVALDVWITRHARRERARRNGTE